MYKTVKVIFLARIYISMLARACEWARCICIKVNRTIRRKWRETECLWKINCVRDNFKLLLGTSTFPRVPSCIFPHSAISHNLFLLQVPYICYLYLGASLCVASMHVCVCVCMFLQNLDCLLCSSRPVKRVNVDFITLRIAKVRLLLKNITLSHAILRIILA